jgi:hypothetical protein
MNSVRDTPKGWVSPFGHPRINDCSHLPAAFRSVPRPSSPLGAKASTERPSLTPYPHHRPRTGPNHAPCNYLSQAVAPASSPASRSNSARRCAPLTHTTDHLHHVKEHAHPQQHPDPIKGSGHRHRAGFGSVTTPHEAAHQTSTVTGRRLGAQPLSLTPRRERKWRRSDSNRRPPAGALPLSYAPAGDGVQQLRRKSKRANRHRLRDTRHPFAFSRKPDFRTAETWWAREDLNLRPHAYQACALTN